MQTHISHTRTHVHFAEAHGCVVVCERTPAPAPGLPPPPPSLPPSLLPGHAHDDRRGQRAEEARSGPVPPGGGGGRGAGGGRRPRAVQPAGLRERPQPVHGELWGADPRRGVPRYPGSSHHTRGGYDT